VTRVPSFTRHQPFPFGLTTFTREKKLTAAPLGPCDDRSNVSVGRRQVGQSAVDRRRRSLPRPDPASAAVSPQVLGDWRRWLAEHQKQQQQQRQVGGRVHPPNGRVQTVGAQDGQAHGDHVGVLTGPLFCHRHAVQGIRSGHTTEATGYRG